MQMFVLFFAICIGVWSPASLTARLSGSMPLTFVGPQSTAASTAAPLSTDQAVNDYNTPSGRACCT